MDKPVANSPQAQEECLPTWVQQTKLGGHRQFASSRIAHSEGCEEVSQLLATHPSGQQMGKRGLGNCVHLDHK